MDSINHLLEDWQNTLSTVINSTPCLLNNSPQVDLASQEARGDCSKPNLYNFSDSDSDFINSSDNFHDNYTVSWTRNLYTPINDYNNCDVSFEHFVPTYVPRETYIPTFFYQYSSFAVCKDWILDFGFWNLISSKLSICYRYFIIVM